MFDIFVILSKIRFYEDIWLVWLKPGETTVDE